ncbi:hypothetical protein ACFOW6_12305 [Fodinicurvata halophila]|uniref:Cholesterol transport system auxiliary component n=1 Tax=Fodinicurvata halophila TaxID=1419723 RepID=A0ABV8UM35_9PROT
MQPLSRRGFMIAGTGAASLALLAGCEMTPPRNDFARIGFDHRQPLRFDVASIEVIQQYEAPREAPYVGHRFPDPLPEVAERWGHQRLKAEGPRNNARFTIQEASVVEQELAGTQGLKRFFVIDQSERYDARLRAELEIRDSSDGARRVVRADVRRSLTVAEDASLTEREAIWFQLTEDLMRRFDREMEQVVRENLTPWLLN